MPGSHKNIIEINGRKYDAKTGRLLDGSIQPVAAGSGMVIDGVVSKSQVITPVQNSLKPKPAVHRSGGTSVKRRTPQRSQILARKAVKKPDHTSTISPKTHVQHTHTPKPQREHHAKSIQKSPYIKRFGSVSEIKKTSADLSVRVPSSEKDTHSSTSHPKEYSQKNHDTAATSKNHAKTEDMLSQALSSLGVSSQKPVKVKKSRAKRSFQWASGLAAGLLLVGFIAYMNYPNLNLKYATSRAGIAAAMPSYNPDGYSFTGPVQYAPGKVTIRFSSNTDQRSYSVSQEISNWNSETLQQTFLSDNNKTFSTAQASGRTIFLYDNTNATWVNGGVWYQVSSDSLSPEQLINIASSL